MVQRAPISIFAMSFIYFLMTPHPTQERIHLQKATAESLLCTLSWPGASNCRLPSRSPSPAVPGLIPATQETEVKVGTRSENCLTHQAAQTRAGARISFFAAAWSLGLCGSLAWWLQSRWPCGGCSIRLWAQLYARTSGQVLGLRPSHKEQ